MQLQLSRRDLSVIQYVSHFKQLTTQHVRDLAFPTQLSHSPAGRSLRRLVAADLLHICGHLPNEGAHGGSGQNVYELGRAGFRLMRLDNPDDRRYQRKHNLTRTITQHTLDIADLYVALVKLQRDGKLTIHGYLTEPDCHMVVGDKPHQYYLEPDLLVELERPGFERTRLLFEVDRASQGNPQILDKLRRYYGAREHYYGHQWPEGQFVYFIAVDDYRADRLRWLFKQDERGSLFLVRTLAEYVAEFE